MIRLVIFDLDGTLLNTIEDLAVSANYALKKHGFPEHDIQNYKYFVGNGITRLIERALPEDARKELTIAEVKETFVTYYQAHITDYTDLYEGIDNLLKELVKRNIIFAVASNKYQAGTEKLVHHFWGDKFFKVVLGQREGISPKPDPVIIHDILSVTGIDKSEALYIGDSGVDMLTAYNCGVTSIGVTWGFRPRTELEANHACHIVDHPDEILRYI